MKHSKIITSICLFAVLSISGCSLGGSSDDEAADAYMATIEIQQNDYRGGVLRTYALKDHVLSIMENMKSNNTVIRSDSPNSYWTTNGYQDFVSTFMTNPIISDTEYFTEEGTDSWDETAEQIGSVDNSFTTYDSSDEVYELDSDVVLTRREKDEYTVTGVYGDLKNLTGVFGSSQTYEGKKNYHILYDCDKDWCKAYATLDIKEANVPENSITAEMFEYARVDNNTFLIQTSIERLLIVLDPVEVDTDIRDRTIKEFYYSRLSGGQRTTYTPYAPLPTLDEDGKEIKENIKINTTRETYALLNEYGEIATVYGQLNSLFLKDDVSKLGTNWVFEDRALMQAIVYKDKTLVVTTYNKLSQKYERFIYAVDKIDEAKVTELEKLVNIEGLVGVIDVSRAEVPNISISSTDTAAESSAVATSAPEDAVSDENISNEVPETSSTDISSVATEATDVTSLDPDTTNSPDETIAETENVTGDATSETSVSDEEISAETSSFEEPADTTSAPVDETGA